MFLISGFAATAAHAGTVPANVRVVARGGKALADVRQYTETTAVPTSPAAKCFFGGAGGSGKNVTLNGPTALGAVADASRSVPELNPVLITDEFSFGLGVCGFGGVQPSPTEFWQVRVDHKATQKGGDQVQVSKGDDVLWALVPTPDCPPPAFVCAATEPELALTAPARAKPGAPFGVTVLAYNDEGFLGPASGATVTGATAPTDASGHTLVSLPKPGTLTASKPGTIPSRALPVCVKGRFKRCPSKRGIRIFGSDLPDSIRGTAGNDVIKARGGNDKISVRGRGRDRVNCGPGIDKVKADRADRIAKNCEKVKRPHRSRRGGK